MDVRTALKQGIAQLRGAGVPSFTLATELLLLHVLGRNRAWLYGHPEEEISPSEAQRFSELLARRAAGEPTQYITGTQEFWGLAFEVTPEVLIPRPETEHVVEVALHRLGPRTTRAGHEPTAAGNGLRILDVGTGSGCIAVALAKELPGARLFATDVSAAALGVARRNAARHGVLERITFLENSLFTGLASEYDLIVSNPPYIGRKEASTLMREVRDHEPQLALYGGGEGYELTAGIIAQAARFVVRGGFLVLELGYNGLPVLRSLFETPAWRNVAVTNDLSGIPRVIAAERTAV